MLNFLDLPPHPHAFEPDQSTSREDMPPETRAELIDYFSGPNEELFGLLGRRYDWTTDRPQELQVPCESRAYAP